MGIGARAQAVRQARGFKCIMAPSLGTMVGTYSRSSMLGDCTRCQSTRVAMSEMKSMMWFMAYFWPRHCKHRADRTATERVMIPAGTSIAEQEEQKGFLAEKTKLHFQQICVQGPVMPCARL